MPAPRRVPALAALLAAVLAVTPSACSGGGRDNQAAGTTTGKRDATANDTDINPVPRDKLPDGGTLRWPLVASPPNFNTGELDGTSADTANVVGAPEEAAAAEDASQRVLELIGGAAAS